MTLAEFLTNAQFGPGVAVGFITSIITIIHHSSSIIHDRCLYPTVVGGYELLAVMIQPSLSALRGWFGLLYTSKILSFAMLPGALPLP